MAKTRTTKALILNPEKTLERRRSPANKTLEMMSSERTLEKRTTTLVILPQLEQHGEQIFSYSQERVKLAP